jgi:hypothetical protein
LTCDPADFSWLFSFVVLIRDPALPSERRPHYPTFGGIFGLDCANPWDACLAWREFDWWSENRVLIAFRQP